MTAPAGKLKFAYDTIAALEGKIESLHALNQQLLEALKQMADRFEQSGAYDHDHTVELAREAIAQTTGETK